MNLSKNDYKKLYQFQDKFLMWWKSIALPFYLTGGTALGRFYLNHRYSEDLDFFINNDDQYLRYIAEYKNKIENQFKFNIEQSLFNEDYTRLFLEGENLILKIEFVNDVAYSTLKPIPFYFGYIDNPLNILKNKITALMGRDEPKDIFDIVSIAQSYSFEWQEIFLHAKHKSVINEIDVEQRFYSFPVECIENVFWLSSPVDLRSFQRDLQQIANDFLLGKANSLGINKIPIEEAKPIMFSPPLSPSPPLL